MSSHVSTLLAAIARISVRAPRRVWVGMFCLGLIGTLVATAVPRDLSFGGVMNREHPEVARYFEASQRHGLGRSLPLLLEGPEDDLDSLRSRVVDKLQAHSGVASVFEPPEQDWFHEHLPYIVGDEAFTAWKKLAHTPNEPTAVRVLMEELEALETRQEVLARPGSRLVLVTLANDSFEVDLDAQVVPDLQAIVDQAVAGSPTPGAMRGRFAGMPALVHQDGQATLGTLAKLAPLSLLLTLLLLVGFDRRIRGLAAVAIPMLVAAGTTAAIVSATLGTLTIMEALFGVIIFGLGIDVAVHLGLRVRDELNHGRDLNEAVDVAYRATGPGVVVGAMTTAGAFAMLATAPELSFRHLGLCGAIGVVACLLWMLTMLPASWRILGQAPAGHSKRSPRQRAIAGVANHAVRYPRAHLAGALIATLVAAMGLGRFHYETDLRAVVNSELDALMVGEQLQDEYGVTAGPWVAEVETLAEAHKLADTWSSTEIFARVESPASILPRGLHDRNKWLKGQAQSLAARLSAPGAEEQLGDAYPLLTALVAAAEMAPPTPATLPESLQARWLTSDQKIRVIGYPSSAHMDARTAKQERLVAREAAPEATSMAVLFEVLLGTDRPWFPRVLAMVAVFVGFILWLDLRRARLCALALVPVTVGTLISVGALCWAGIAFNTVTMMAVPLIIGLGVDDGVHLVHRLREYGSDRAGEAATAVGSAIWLTTATTCASFGTLALSGHPGMQSMGLVMLVALPVCLWASISTLPALASIRGPKRANDTPA